MKIRRILVPPLLLLALTAALALLAAVALLLACLSLLIGPLLSLCRH